jgi:hypothetical protein
MNPVTSIDPAVFQCPCQPRATSRAGGPEPGRSKAGTVPSGPCQRPAFGEPGVCHTCETVLIAGDVDYKPGSPRRRSNNRDRRDSRKSSTHQTFPVTSLGLCELPTRKRGNSCWQLDGTHEDWKACSFTRSPNITGQKSHKERNQLHGICNHL